MGYPWAVPIGTGFGEVRNQWVVPYLGRIISVICVVVWCMPCICVKVFVACVVGIHVLMSVGGRYLCDICDQYGGKRYLCVRPAFVL